MATAVSVSQPNCIESGQRNSADEGRLSASPVSPARWRRACHVRWQRRPDAETGREQICILDVETGEIIAIVCSLFDVWFS